jgi:hypothetical protein
MNRPNLFLKRGPKPEKRPPGYWYKDPSTGEDIYILLPEPKPTPPPEEAPDGER